MTKYFRDFYGCTAAITGHKDGTATLKISDPHGHRVFRATFTSERGARISMGKQSDCWTEVKKA